MVAMISQVWEPASQGVLSKYDSILTSRALLEHTHPEHCKLKPNSRQNEEEKGLVTGWFQYKNKDSSNLIFHFPFLCEVLFAQKNQSDLYQRGRTGRKGTECTVT